MKRLLAIELQKIWLNKASRTLTLTYFILLSFIALISSIQFDFGAFKFHLADMGIFNFPYIWHFNTYVAASFYPCAASPLRRKNTFCKNKIRFSFFEYALKMGSFFRNVSIVIISLNLKSHA